MKTFKQMRIEKKMTLAQASKALGMSRQGIHAIEAGKCELRSKHISQVARLYDVPVSDILAIIERKL